jgi:hypothetical protein
MNLEGDYSDKVSEKGEPLTKEELVSIIRRDIDEAEDFDRSYVHQQRARGYQYYYGDDIGDAPEGKSHHVSKDIFNVVETAKSICLETFTQNENVVYFTPINAGDYYAAKQATAYVNHVFYRENAGYKIIHDAFHDGFVAKNGLIKRWWKQEKSYSIERFDEIEEDELRALLSDPNVELRTYEQKIKNVPIMAPGQPVPQNQPINAPPTPMGGAKPSPPPNPQQAPPMNPQAPPQGMSPGQPPMGAPPLPTGAPPQGSAGVPPMQGGPPMQQGQQPTAQPIGMQQIQVFTGEITRMMDTSHVAIMNIKPEDFIIEDDAESIPTSKFCAIRSRMTKSDCLEMGWEADIIDGLNFGDTGIEWRDRDEVDARHAHDGTFMNLWNDASKDRRTTIVYEVYRKIDMDGDGIVELWQLFFSDDEILSMEQVEEVPLEVFTPYPQPYKFHGLSIPDVIWGIQKSKSTIERQIIDNMVATNTGRYLADLGFIRNPKDLVDNRPGVVVNVTKMDAVIPMPIAQINPNSFAVLEMLEGDKEEATGATRLAQGMEKDAISKQNSFDTIQMLTTAANRRLMMFAKHFAENTLKPLLIAIHRIGMTYDKTEKFVQLNGQFVPVEPATFKRRMDMSIRVALTPMEQKEQINNLMMIHNLLRQTPGLMVNYGTEQQFVLMQKMMEYMNIDCREHLLMNPASPQYQAAMAAQNAIQQRQMQLQDGMMTLEANLKQAQAQSLMSSSQTNQFKATVQHQEDTTKLQLSQTEHEDKLAREAADLRIKENSQQTDDWYKREQIRIADAELAIKKSGGTGI